MKIIVLKKAQKFILKQPMPQAERLLKAIYRLPLGDVKPLKNEEGIFRLRVGDYRIFFRMDESLEIIMVESAGNRGDIYKQL
jgi:mRNA interferase RelE/StbE